jgi:Protein of unknown function DUF262
MSFQTAITIYKTIQAVTERKYLLPAIQRELVWDADQIESLFDSILSGYPIGSFLFWDVDKAHSKDYQFYEFIKDYHERDLQHNPPANIVGEQGLTAILDGQQRITALYIGFCGTYSTKVKWKRWDSPGAFPVRRLYLNILAPSPDAGETYQFKFLTKAESDAPTEDVYWFPLGDVFQLEKPNHIHAYLVKHGISDSEFAGECLFGLHDAVMNRGIINYYLEEDQDLDRVLQIFIRVNSGGTQLSYSDLLLSTATAQWKQHDARLEINNLVHELNAIGSPPFRFDKDFVLKSCLVLCDLDVRFRVNNFTSANSAVIESKWADISHSLRQAARLLAAFGFNGLTLTSNNAVIPVAYYLLKHGLPSNYVESAAYREDRMAVQQWLTVALLKGTFGGQSDTVLTNIRTALQEQTGSFPADAIGAQLLKLGRSSRFEIEEIEDLMESRYGRAQTFLVLSLLYPTLDYRNLFHQDHIVPRSSLTPTRLRGAGGDERTIQFARDNLDFLPNLQLLEGTPNEEKSDAPFQEWLDRTCQTDVAKRDYFQKHYIPPVDFAPANFRDFFESRQRLLVQRLGQKLGVTGVVGTSEAQEPSGAVETTPQ